MRKTYTIEHSGLVGSGPLLDVVPAWPVLGSDSFELIIQAIPPASHTATQAAGSRGLVMKDISRSVGHRYALDGGRPAAMSRCRSGGGSV